MPSDSEKIVLLREAVVNIALSLVALKHAIAFLAIQVKYRPSQLDDTFEKIDEDLETVNRNLDELLKHLEASRS